MRRGDRRRAGRSALEAFTRALEAERPRWLVPVVLAVPFLVVIAAARGLTVTVPTFHGGDETVYHYPTIVRFAHQWPGIDLVHYPAAQTPLLHVVMATLSQLVGLEVWRLRLLDALISYGAALVLYRMLRRRRRLEPPAALALTSLVVISPYVFAESFLLLTDNAALGLIIVTLDQLERFRERPRVVPFALAALAACAAVLTRQSAGFVFVVVCGYLLLSWRAIDWPARLVSLGLPVLAALPMALLALAWGGFVPIGADTSSCGLCATAAGRVDQAGAGLFLRSVSFTLAVVGVYAIVLFAPALVAGMRRRAPGAALGAVVGRPLVRARLRLALRWPSCCWWWSRCAGTSATPAGSGGWPTTRRFCSGTPGSFGSSYRWVPRRWSCAGGPPRVIGSARCSSEPSCWWRCRLGWAIRSTTTLTRYWPSS